MTASPTLPAGPVTSHRLTKDDFRRGRDCPAKLWYKKRRYPNTNEGDEFLQYLAEQGHLVGKIAQMCYPEGHLIDTLDLQEAAAQTARLLREENVVIFEPLVQFGRQLARIDILVKTGTHCELIEVKAKKAPASFLTKMGDRVRADWQPYVEDVAFQLQVAQHSLPHLTFTPYLMLTDGTAVVAEARLPACFRVTRRGREVAVQFDGAPAQRDALVRLLRKCEVAPEVTLVREAVAAATEELEPIAAPNAPHPRSSLSAACAKCEYRVDEDEPRNGFRECWGPLAQATPHVFDLHKRDLLKGGGNRVVNQMIAERRVTFDDIGEGEWGDPKKDYRRRQALQVEYTRRNEEWIDPALGGILARARYPLQFIDFEFDQPAVPHVPGTAPWNRIAFQWSLHRIEEPGGPCVHEEFLATEALDPHPAFLSRLRDALDLEGSVMVWSPAEAATLRNLVTGRDAPGMQAWLDRLLAPDGPILDMERLAARHHFDPAMKGQTSIKVVFPVAWKRCAAVPTMPECADFLQPDPTSGERIDPYKLLASRHPDFPVADGTSAILAYHQLLDGRLVLTEAATRRRQLLDYCRLDTLAMRVIWRYWEERLDADA